MYVNERFLSLSIGVFFRIAPSGMLGNRKTDNELGQQTQSVIEFRIHAAH